jgi:MoaA/NifB/PqqE/SkfB family radical SAM enzyme
MDSHPAAVQPRAPASCFWDITDACNLRCLHCEAEAGRAAPDELSADEIARVARDLAAAGCREVFLTGGEPLVRPDWHVIARRIREIGMRVTVITNGLLANAANIRRMIDAGATGISVSIDGTREVHDEIRVSAGPRSDSRYDLAVSAVRLAVASPLRVGVITQIHRRNIGELRQMYEQMVSLGIDVWQVQICMPLGRMRPRAADYVLEPAQIDDLQQQLAELIDEGRLHVAVGDNIGYYGRHEPTLRG